MRSKDGYTPFSLVDQKSKIEVKLQPENILGRESGLKTETMSRRHCQIVTKENRWFLADLDSTNGTFLNGKKMKSREWYSMKVGDEIEFGSMVFNFTGPMSKTEANIEKPRAETVSTTLPRDGQATSRNKVQVPKERRGKEGTSEADAEPEASPGGVESAGFLIRLGAQFIDNIAASAVSTPVAMLLGPKTIVASVVQLVIFFAVIFIPLFLRRQTLGKMAVGLHIVQANGEPVSFGRILLRELAGKGLGMMVPAAISGVTLAINPLVGMVVMIVLFFGMIIMYRREGEAFWDLWFKTRVVPVPEREF